MSKKFISTMAFVLGCAGCAFASPSADIYVLRLGDGSAALNEDPVPMTVMRYNSSGTLLGSWAAPYDPNDPDARITTLGGHHLYGALTTTQDGSQLVFGGMNAPTGGSRTNNVVATFSLQNQTFDISTNPERGIIRSVATVDASAYWYVGSSTGGGVNYVEHGSDEAINVASNTHAYARIHLIDDKVWMTREAAGTRGLYYLNVPEEDGLPTTAEGYGRVQVLGDGHSSGSGNYHDFFFLDENTLFMSEGGFMLAVWELNEDTGLYDRRDITEPGNALINDPEFARMELALSPFSGPNDEEITIYFTGSKTNADNSLWSVTWNTDTKTFGEAMELASAGEGYAFAGLVAVIPEPGTVGLLFGAFAVSAVLIRRRLRS